MEDEIKEIRMWFPLANRYNPDGKTDYRFPQLTERITNSPSWTEFDEFIKSMITTLSNQKPKMENIPVNNRNRVDNIGGYTNFAVGHHVERTEHGGNI